MGFQDAEWAYTLDLPSTQKVVLVAICHRTNDKNHETFVGRKTIAEMLGITDRAVTNALGALDSLGLITRTKRHRKGGYRDTDLLTVNRSWEPPKGNDVQVNQVQVNEILVNEVPISSEPRSNLRGTTFQGITSKEVIVTQGSFNDHSTRARTFDEFYAIWPKKVDKPAAERAWVKAIKRHDPNHIIAAAIAYRDNPHLPPKQFIRNPATWLNGDGWNDDLPTARDGKQTPTERAQQTFAAGQRVAARRFGNLTSLNPRKEISA